MQLPLPFLLAQGPFSDLLLLIIGQISKSIAFTSHCAPQWPRPPLSPDLAMVNVEHGGLSKKASYKRSSRHPTHLGSRGHAPGHTLCPRTCNPFPNPCGIPEFLKSASLSFGSAEQVEYMNSFWFATAAGSIIMIPASFSNGCIVYRVYRIHWSRLCGILRAATITRSIFMRSSPFGRRLALDFVRLT